MSTIYVQFTSSSDTVLSKDCTTRWADSIGCHIPMCGQYTEKYTNLMVMTGDEQEIQDWLSENIGKVVEITEEEGDAIGQLICPEGTTTVIREHEGDGVYEKTYTAGLFTMSEGQTWTLTDSVEI